MNFEFNDMDTIINAVRLAAEFPSIAGAKLLPDRSVVSRWTKPEIVKGEQVSFGRVHVLSDNLEVLHRGDPIVINSNIKLECWSPSGVLKALIVSKKNEGSEEKYFLEIWNKVRQLHVWDVSAKDLHGPIYTDGEFGCLSWSQDESKLVYVAEKKYPKSESPFCQKPVKSEEPPNVVDRYLYREDWGEQTTGKHHSVVCILTVNTGDIQILNQIEDGYTAGLVEFVGDAGVVGVAWNEEPYRLGVIYCSNRNSHIFYASLDGQYRRLSEANRSVFFPRATPDGNSIIYLDREEGGPHRRSYRLLKYCFKTDKRSILVDNVYDWDGVGFAGLYTHDRLPKCCWINDFTIVFNSIRENRSISYIVKVVGNGVTLIEFPCDKSLKILDVSEGLVVGKKSDFGSPDSLIVGKLPGTINETTMAEFSWVLLDELNTNDVLSKIKIKHMKLNSKSGLRYNSLLVVPESADDKIPWILCPHGGPHSVFTDEYSWGLSFYLHMGMAVLLVNYTGSLGQGDASVEKLLGNIGRVDVDDIYMAGKEASRLEPKLNPYKKFVIGGSHGGFLVTHLIAQYPDEYKACSARNPVINLSSMVAVTDIPDWNYVESGLEFDYKNVGDAACLSTMFDVSPVSLVDCVKTPTLLLVGEEDRRVPPSQSYYYYKMLKARGVPVRLLKYPDCHSLAKVDVACDVMVNTMKWFLEHS